MSTPVQSDQFEISPSGITHTPTGAKYSPHPDSTYSGTLTLTLLGNALANDDDYRPSDVQAMMEQLWVDYVEANPRLF